MQESGETGIGRLEAFSDGVFAIAITLLVLDLHVPHADSERQLLAALRDQWPVYFAYVTSFVTVLIMWINHHVIFSCIRRSDHGLFLLNGLLLLCITVVPYPTSLLAAYLQHAGGTTAAAIYSGTFEITAVAFNCLWRYAIGHPRLLHPRVNPQFIQTFSRQYNFGPLLYLIAFGLAFVRVELSLAVNFALAVLFALPTRVESLLPAD